MSAQKIAVGDKVSDTVNKISTGGQVVSVVSRAVVNAKSVATITVPTGTIVVDEDVMTISHTGTPQINGTPGQSTFIIGQ